MTAIPRVGPLACLLSLSLTTLVPSLAGQSQPVITDAIIGESNPISPEISTAQLQQVLNEGKTPVLDVRSAQEYAIAHIPGSINHYEKEVEQITKAYPDHNAALVLYCNGPYCGKSKRLSEELQKQGYTNLRRYQLGLPVWRALGNTVQTDLPGVRYVLAGDKTAVWVDARSAETFAKGSLPGAVNIAKGEAEAANDDGRLPKKDKGTRVIVFGDSPEDARAVAEEIAHKAYWNSSYFGGRFSDLRSVAGR
ncbi:MAG TPA: rhodanese-like domain-containing protein [Gemmatimonadales bacterium]|jgi:rhodanese-related sulfurtransferase|nr:rhodanese-like domain-containing protein [Gemmatimonadales bacterium]